MAAELRESYRRCIEWVSDWCAVDPDQVLLTSGATDALDTALTTRKGLPSIIVHSDLGHECTRSSVVCAADYLGSIGGRAIPVAEVKISDLFGRDPHSFAAELALRIAALCDARNGVLVLEHVTSRDGFCLPLSEISRYLRSALPEIDLVIDGAQAAGLCRPPAGLHGAYAACFHKYIDGPAGTGFCVLPRAVAGKALHRVRATLSGNAPVVGEHLPTTDVTKWEACKVAVDALRARSSPECRLARVLDLRRELLEKLPGTLRTNPSAVRAEYRSHIISVNLPDKDKADTIWRALVGRGFSTKRLDDGIRVTLHDTLDSQAIGSFTEALNSLMSGSAQR